MTEDYFLNLQPGTIVNGRYEVVKCLGTGSMGLVYACRHRELSGHLVAMKVLFAEVARDEVAAARFRNEIVASYGVNHQNVVRAYEYFRDGDLVAFTMEFVGGGDLADLIGLDEQIPIPQIILMLKQMCGGVQAIHDAGIIHRDLKPENILLTENGDIKITDFGIARTGTGPKLTEHGGVVGTIDYVSPEYLERGQVDFRSDIYALGVLGYEMVTGESPFKGNSVIETMTMRLKTDPTPPHELRPDCPPALSQIIMNAMSRNPDDRYQRAQLMLDDLVRIHVDDRVAREEFVSIPSVIAKEGSGRATAVRDTSDTVSVDSGIFKSLGDSFPEDDSFEKSSAGTVEEVSEERIPKRVVINDLGESSYRSEALLKPQNPKKIVSVSQSRLSSQRIKELSEELNYHEAQNGDFLTVFMSIIVVGAGLVVGLLILSKFFPAHMANIPILHQLISTVSSAS